MEWHDEGGAKVSEPLICVPTEAARLATVAELNDARNALVAMTARAGAAEREVKEGE